MGLTTALSSALSGLRATQTGINVVATNVANAETPGYSRKTLSLETALAGGSGIGVRVANVNRELDLYVQRQLRTELAGANYIDTIAQVRQQIDRMYGEPGSASALDTIINGLTSSLQALSAEPQSVSTRQAVVNAAQVMAQKLHSLSSDVTLMRNQAESGIGDAVERVNGLLKTIENVQTQIIALSSQEVELGALLDQRDLAINELAGLIDIQITPNGVNNVSIFTNSGISLFDMQASQLNFDPKPLSAQSLWNADPSLSGTGTIQLVSPSGYTQDLIADGSIRSGKIALEQAHLVGVSRRLRFAESLLLLQGDECLRCFLVISRLLRSLRLFEPCIGPSRLGLNVLLCQTRSCGGRGLRGRFHHGWGRRDFRGWLAAAEQPQAAQYTQRNQTDRIGRIGFAHFHLKFEPSRQTIAGFRIAPPPTRQHQRRDVRSPAALCAGKLRRVVAGQLDALGAAGKQPDGGAFAVPG